MVTLDLLVKLLVQNIIEKFKVNDLFIYIKPDRPFTYRLSSNLKKDVKICIAPEGYYLLNKDR